MTDSYKHKGERKKLVKELIRKGIKNQKILDIVGTIPRHFFIADTALHEHAYEDKAFPIDAEQTISQPYTVAFQTELLDINPSKREKVLEIGTGSGYQTTVLSHLNCKIFSVERQKILFDKTKKLLDVLGVRAKLFYGDGYKGLPMFAPFDKIIVTAGAPYVPKDLLEQLKIGGVLIIPVGEGKEQIMKKITKKTAIDFSIEEKGVFKFVPLLQEKAKG